MAEGGIGGGSDPIRSSSEWSSHFGDITPLRSYRSTHDPQRYSSARRAILFHSVVGAAFCDVVALSAKRTQAPSDAGWPQY